MRILVFNIKASRNYEAGVRVVSIILGVVKTRDERVLRFAPDGLSVSGI